MINPNRHLKNIHRVNLDDNDRFDYLRLDKNEYVGYFPDKIWKDAMSKITPSLLSMYPEYGKLKDKIAEVENLKRENVIIGNGSDSIIKNIFETYTSLINRVVLTNPTFAMYSIYCKMYHVFDTMSINYESLLSFPKKEFVKVLEASFGKKVAVIVNPNNPTGHAIKREDLVDIIKIANKKDILLVVDEAYHYFHKETVADLVDKYDNLIVLRTFSKFFGLAGLRFGFGLAHPSIIENLRKVQCTFPVNIFAVKFAEAIFDNYEIYDDLYNAFLEGKKYIIKKLEEEGIEYHVGKANFILIKCKQDVIEKLKERNILISGNFEQDILKDYIRVTIGNKDSMKYFFDNFIEVV